MNEYDFIIVGSGINSLTCAALLGKAGHTVLVLERNDYLGGCIRTEELTLPGFKHDVMSQWHPLFVTSPSYAELAEDLARHGLEYLNTDKPTASIGSDMSPVVMTTNRDANIKRFNQLAEGDGDGFAKTMTEMEQDAEFTFALLGSQMIRWRVLWLLYGQLRKRGLQGLIRFFGEAMSTCKDWLDQHFRSAHMSALFAPWVLHTGLGPMDNFSGAMTRVIAFSLEVAGMPVVKGGSRNLTCAFAKLIVENKGDYRLNAHVDKVIVRNGRAAGVQVEDRVTHESLQFFARKGVICNVTPQQLYTKLLEAKYVSPQVTDDAKQYQFGRADMQIHLALDSSPTWVSEELNSVPMVHIADGVESVAKAVNQAECGLLPDAATIVVGQPTLIDPSRAPEGKAILWIQLQELPSIIRGDSAGEIAIGPDGAWTEEIREQYADRIINRLYEFMPDLKAKIIARTVISPADLQARNINLVGGDPYSGHCGMQQFFAWRPLKSTQNHDTPVRGLFHIGASTHPGPGLGGNSGYMVAKQVG